MNDEKLAEIVFPHTCTIQIYAYMHNIALFTECYHIP